MMLKFFIFFQNYYELIVSKTTQKIKIFDRDYHDGEAASQFSKKKK